MYTVAKKVTAAGLQYPNMSFRALQPFVLARQPTPILVAAPDLRDLCTVTNAALSEEVFNSDKGYYTHITEGKRKRWYSKKRDIYVQNSTADDVMVIVESVKHVERCGSVSVVVMDGMGLEASASFGSSTKVEQRFWLSAGSGSLVLLPTGSKAALVSVKTSEDATSLRISKLLVHAGKYLTLQQGLPTMF